MRTYSDIATQLIADSGVSFHPHARTILIGLIADALDKEGRAALLTAVTHIRAAMDDCERRSMGAPELLQVSDIRRLADEIAAEAGQ